MLAHVLRMPSKGDNWPPSSALARSERRGVAYCLCRKAAVLRPATPGAFAGSYGAQYNVLIG